MIKLPKRVMKQTIDHLQRAYPAEGCGFLVGTKEGVIFVPSNNEHHDPNSHARVTNWDEAEDLGEVLAFVHSHPDATAEASDADLAQCETHGIPWLIVALPSLELAWYSPRGYTAPILRRTFVYGVHDCATLLRDWHKQEMGIEYEVEDSEWGWWDNGENHYVERLPTYGFVKQPVGTEPEVGDVILMQIRAAVPNHGAVYIGDGMILHHPVGHLSRRDVYVGMWVECTVSIWRHKNAQSPSVR